MKHKFGRLEDGFTLASLRLKDGKIDVSKDYLDAIDSQLADAKRLAAGARPIGFYYTYMHLRGRVDFATWINRHRKLALVRQLHSIDWKAVDATATAFGLQAAKKRLAPRHLSHAAV